LPSAKEDKFPATGVDSNHRFARQSRARSAATGGAAMVKNPEQETMSDEASRQNEPLPSLQGYRIFCWSIFQKMRLRSSFLFSI